MKKFLTLCLLASVMLLAASCKDVKPDFKFNLDLVGAVENAPTAIAGNFSVQVANAQPDTCSNFDAAELSAIETNEQACDWLDDYITANVLAYLDDDPATLYDFTVKGYVKEVVTGISLSVDRRYTNKPAE